MSEVGELRDPTILIVDDDEVDVRAVTRSLKRHGVSNPIEVVGNGVEALALLRGEGGQRIAEPFIILLDLNMPRMDGHEFLEVLRNDPVHRGTVVFVLTTSNDRRDLVSAYDKHVAGYIVKTDAGSDFIHLVSMLEQFSLAVRFPATTHVWSRPVADVPVQRTAGAARQER